MNLAKKFSKEKCIALGATALSVLLYVLSMPGMGEASLAWVWAVPMTLWAATRPRWKTWIIAAAIGSWLSGVLMLIWLRHLYPPLGWLAVTLLPLGYSLFPFLWLLAVRWIFPESGKGHIFPARFFNLLGLAGLWVFLEWILTWFLSGFPWMPIGATQWERPAMLAYAQWTGPAGISFMVILFNLCVARYFRHLVVDVRLPAGVPRGDSQSMFRSLRNLCPEFYCALLLLLLSVFVYWGQCLNFARNNEKYFSFAAVQTDFDPQKKWDTERVPVAAGVLETLTLDAVNNNPAPDFVIWPEAAMPLSVDSPGYRQWLENLSKRANLPLVVGGICINEEENRYYNSVHLVYPKSGLMEEFYAKRHLVPFGEYLPFEGILPIRKIVPAAADCVAGTSADPLDLFLKKSSFRMGALVCYEDVFPEMGRELVRNGADFLAIVTNDAWYGQEAGAYQHAAHSALQAVSLGVPVIRCGNAGWSGVISPIGHISVMTDNGNEDGTIYFRGQQSFDVYGWCRKDTDGNALRIGGNTFYARHGNWFITLSGLLFLSVYLRHRRWKKRKQAPSHESTRL